jgi:hypothetical protein
VLSGWQEENCDKTKMVGRIRAAQNQEMPGQAIDGTA